MNPLFEMRQGEVDPNVVIVCATIYFVVNKVEDLVLVFWPTKKPARLKARLNRSRRRPRA
ncbi:hypothetical protein EDF35_3958 [Rathayibacter sp. PhB151]|uniref:hypothetical protein n=1 Tax=Rathayibacter sp. PhB151 TaxID=2485189 RepID=UPI00106371D1|nr:hypothetical protein [Rathayibacter sp. PhB151]TDX74982.1 hypothetical protein EDF35_3958 [Rathayibacter sp. PhB151]